MKPFLFACLAVVLVGGVAHAGAGLDLKWNQLPDGSVNGYDFSSETLAPSTVADDFLCNDPRAITDIHWWGSYWTALPLDKNSDHHGDPSFPAPNVAPVMPSTVASFLITFYSDVPALTDPQMPHSHPGGVLSSQTVQMNQVVTNLHGIIDRDANAILGDDGDEAVWGYDVILPTPFAQTPGTIYWLSIEAANTGAGNPSNIQWGWHESSDHWNDNAVQHGPAAWGPDYANTQWVNLAPKDMAFQLTVPDIPEPATLGLISSGLIWIATARRRSRK